MEQVDPELGRDLVGASSKAIRCAVVNNGDDSLGSLGESDAVVEDATKVGRG